VGQGHLIHEVSRSHTTTHHRRQDVSGRVINLSQRPLPDNTQIHNRQTSMPPGEIRTQNLSRRADADLRLRPRGHRDRHIWIYKTKNKQYYRWCMNSGIYELTCDTCNRSYVGQTSRTWKQRYQEHLKYIKQNDPQSTYALHVLNNSREFGPIINP